jgi:hypothetical protein
VPSSPLSLAVVSRSHASNMWKYMPDR